MTVVATPARGKTVQHLVADSEQALQWLAQNSVLELHAWHSRAESLTQPDWVVFDLDPAEGRGIDLQVPLAKGHTFEDAQAFAIQVGETVATQLPQVTLERALAKRKGRLYFD